MDSRSLSCLQLDELLELLAGRCQTPMGRAAAESLRPSLDKGRIHVDLARTAEGTTLLKTRAQFGLAGVEDPGDALAQLRVEGTKLEPRQILVLERNIQVGMDLRAQFRAEEVKDYYPHLSVLGASIPDMTRPLAAIRGKILPSGELDDNASPELRRIRREYGDRRTRIHRSLETILRTQTRVMQEDLITIRNGRFVIPVRSEAKREVPGVMHGLSSSGLTTFVEPLSVIEQNNELVALRDREEMEISRILLAISEVLRQSLTEITVLVRRVAEFDLIQAKSRLAVEYECVRPEIAESGRFRLQEARHLLLEHALRRTGSTIVPVSFEMDENHPVMIISGPNAGGKTVALKTAGLAVLMAQMGMLVPARSAELPLFVRVFADIGDQQSISANLSTFTAHMRNIAVMLGDVHSPALVLLDEIGTGTDPDEGAALAIALAESFRRNGALLIATTHYNELKIWASQSKGVLNASVEFDDRTLQPTYRLLTGFPGASCGVEIARRIGVPEEILTRAAELRNPDQLKAGAYLQRLRELHDGLESDRRSLAEEQRALAAKGEILEHEYAEREKTRREHFERELASVIRNFQEESLLALKDLKDRAESLRMRKIAQRRNADLRKSAARLREKMNAEPPSSGPASGSAEPHLPPREEIKPGDAVEVRSLSRQGTVESIEDGVYSVRIGVIRFRAKLEDLASLSKDAGADAAAAARVPQHEGLDLDRSVPVEVNVIGMRVDEAEARVDKFLDESYLAGLETVRIIHGHGTGALRKAIAAMLKGHIQVESFGPAPPEQGGSGATLVVLRQ